MTERKRREATPVDLTDSDLDQAQGASRRGSTELKADTRDEPTKGMPVYDLVDDFAP